jgi:hypothetical protein
MFKFIKSWLVGIQAEQDKQIYQRGYEYAAGGLVWTAGSVLEKLRDKAALSADDSAFDVGVLAACQDFEEMFHVNLTGASHD